MGGWGICLLSHDSMNVKTSPPRTIKNIPWISVKRHQVVIDTSGWTMMICTGSQWGWAALKPLVLWLRISWMWFGGNHIWHSHFCCQMLFCLGGSMIRPPVGKVTDRVYWPPSALCLTLSLYVCVCVFIVRAMCWCESTHTALIRPLIPGCRNTAGVKWDT